MSQPPDDSATADNAENNAGNDSALDEALRDDTIEADRADLAEGTESTPVWTESEWTGEEAELDPEADPADVAEQRRMVQLDEDEYR